ncbi:MAG: DUF2309 domain-containing protein [Halobacteriales archaeon]|nr:DUF2309 domain-containing protein [Halobacteriales archaeon]
MSTDIDVRDSIERAADVVGPVWPLYSFVTANPLAGFEEQPFHEGVEEGRRLFGANGYPSADMFRRAWTTGRIDADILDAKLTEHGYTADPATLLDRMAEAEHEDPNGGDGKTATDRVDQVLTKWLAAFLDQGKAHWPMPNREQGFYTAVRSVAHHDREIPDREQLAELPEDPIAAIKRILADQPEEQWPTIFESQLAALPGWTGFIKQRIADETAWQSTYPISLAGYLAIRLALTDLFDAPIAPPAPATAHAEDPPGSEDVGDTDTTEDGMALPAIWLAAWEATYREQLVDAITDASVAQEENDESDRPAAQLVFCIDTRSEIIRRHVEAAGDYETHGYAGFFGIPMRYEGYDTAVTVDACPPILEAEHRIRDRPTGEHDAARDSHDRWSNTLDAGRELMDALKTNAATAFSFVESAGVGYGAALATRTLLPARVYDLLAATDDRVPDDHEFCAPALEYDPDTNTELSEGLTLEEQVEYAATAFELMGIEQFARVVVFTGHASQTANNPFDSSLDCGACAGNPGGPSARVLAAICNDDTVRAKLRNRGITIPDDTIFVAGQHNTTTDEIELYDGTVPESHAADIEQLRADLAVARANATAERAGDMQPDVTSGVRETERRAGDWAETRPEWGLAGNAAFVIGPRALTDGLDLDGRSFLHSYDWTTDPNGDALEAIMTGPMVVTQWINTQYYFATVDNAVYGSGSKVTHNPIGNVGVYQGNGGDLMTGLPLQSLRSTDDELYHQPLRLSTVIHAPVERVTEILREQEPVATLLDNQWLSLTVVDPQQNHRALHYDGELSWTAPSDDATATTPAPKAQSSIAED